MRTPDSYASGLLELQCVARYPDPHPGAIKGESVVLSIDSSGNQIPRTAETALVAHEVSLATERCNYKCSILSAVTGKSKFLSYLIRL